MKEYTLMYIVYRIFLQQLIEMDSSKCDQHQGLQVKQIHNLKTIQFDTC